jgi:deazaflavin-dependent oxidoreductase (nitroreductase family)
LEKLVAFKRWLYKGGRPNALGKIINQGWAWLHSSGLLPDYMVTLEVVGRQSGKTLSFPLAVAVIDGERYLVSMLGEDTNWVRNVRAANGKAVLRHGKSEQIQLEEVEISQRAPILKAYLKIAPGARPHIPVDKDAPVSEFEKIAAKFPVFKIRAIN